ncbi:MAG: hypothetical protein PHZ26_03155 [Candidatus Gracilibacteria bacterium]|nr:hypothetical protein [Candidatus Gracilibacteria bacterium]MDD2908725.1 hypothetical protein [Candidatus Gracilibacteria bacterium]
MNYKSTIFDYGDFSIIFDEYNRDYLKTKIAKLCEEEILVRLTKGIYYLKDRGYDSFELPTKLYSPSYISFHSALYHHSMIFQLPNRISFAYKRNIEKTIGKDIIYSKRLKEEILYNLSGIITTGAFSIADKERAFLDTLYIYGDFYFDNLNELDKNKVIEMLEIYKNKSFSKKIELYLKKI